MPKANEALALLGGAKTVAHPYPPYPVIGHEEVNAATEVVMSRNLSECGRGAYVGRMEDAYAAYFGSKFCLSFSSGTAAIHAALFALGVGPGTEVLTCNHNWISAITAIMHAGGTPVLCDTARNAWHIDPAEIRRKATPNTKAVVVTHLWGIPADMDPILKVCAKLGLPVLEDVSHSHGSRYKGRLCGTIGDIGAFSLQGSKAIVAGEGGFMLTNTKRYYQRAMVPGHHGVRLSAEATLNELKPFAQGGGAWSYRIFPVAAAIATAQLKKLPTLNAARQANFDRLHARIRRFRFLTWPRLAPKSVRSWYSTPALFCAAKAGISRDTFVKAVAAQGVAIGGEGYGDWSQIPLFQNMKLYGQMFPVRHANGVTFQPVKKGTLANFESMRTRMILIGIPAVECPLLMDQVADAMEKVAANVPALRKWEKAQAKKAGK